MVPLTHFGPDPAKTVYQILHEYRIHNADVLFREDSILDDLIDVIEGNRKYVKCLYVWNKIDTVSIETCDRLAREPHSIVASCGAALHLNLDALVDRIWEYLNLTRIYTKKRGQHPDLKEPVVMTAGRFGCSVESFCSHIHRDLIRSFKVALVWGVSVKHAPQHCGLSHVLGDEDVVQIVTMTAAEQKASKDYSKQVQEYWDKYKEKKKKVALKS
jgi:ribosome-interacting GTPase 1